MRYAEKKNWPKKTVDFVFERYREWSFCHSAVTAEVFFWGASGRSVNSALHLRIFEVVGNTLYDIDVL